MFVNWPTNFSLVNLINLSLQLNGYAIAAAQKQLQELKQQVEHNYAAYIETKKTEILKHHLKNNSLKSKERKKFITRLILYIRQK